MAGTRRSFVGFDLRDWIWDRCCSFARNWRSSALSLSLSFSRSRLSTPACAEFIVVIRSARLVALFGCVNFVVPAQIDSTTNQAYPAFLHKSPRPSAMNSRSGSLSRRFKSSAHKVRMHLVLTVHSMKYKYIASIVYPKLLPMIKCNAKFY